MRMATGVLAAAALAMAACGDSPTKAELGPQFVGSYAFDVEAAPVCWGSPGLPVAHFRWRVEAVKGGAGNTRFALAPADDLQGRDSLHLVLRPAAGSAAGEVSGSVRLERAYPSGYVIGFTNGTRSGTLTGRLETTPDGRAEVVQGVLAGPIAVVWTTSFGDHGSICDSLTHSWSLRAL